MKDVSITLVNESCFSFLKELESNSIDLALIDPPYEVSRETNFKSGEAKGKDTDRFRVSMDFGDWDSDFTGLDEVIKELYRVLRKGGTLICFYDIWKISILRRYFDDAKFRQIRFIEWVKTNPVPINSKINYLTNAREIAVVAVKEGKATFHSEYDNGIYRYPICHDRERFHPTQKPLALIEELVIKHDEAETQSLLYINAAFWQLDMFEFLQIKSTFQALKMCELMALPVRGNYYLPEVVYLNKMADAFINMAKQCSVRPSSIYAVYAYANAQRHLRELLASLEAHTPLRTKNLFGSQNLLESSLPYETRSAKFAISCRSIKIYLMM